jgi:G3E family GTPase
MAKVDIFSGFLGAGKTTLIKKLISEGYETKNIVLIENEFGEIGVDTGFLRESGIKINEMVAGCICCTLVGDFGKALNEVVEQYDPDRILIEPSGVGKLSDVIIAVQDLLFDLLIPDDRAGDQLRKHGDIEPDIQRILLGSRFSIVDIEQI